MRPPGRPPVPPDGGGATTFPGNLASPWLRIVGGLIDVIILAVVTGLLVGITHTSRVLAVLVWLVAALAYFSYFWSERGQTIGMMLFGFKVRDIATGRYPDPGKAALRGFVWSLEVVFMVCCLIGALGWLWQVWDPRRQAFHDKVAGTIVTAN